MTRICQYYQMISDDQLRQELTQMRAGGLIWDDIAKYYGMANSTLRSVVLGKGWSLDDFPIDAHGTMTIPTEVSKAFRGGRSKTAWEVPEDFEQQISEMRAEGLTWMEIAKFYHASTDTIRKTVARMGKSTRDYPAPATPRTGHIMTAKAGTLCWDCANAVPSRKCGTGCSWSRRFEPVEGWTAERCWFKVNGGRGTVADTYTVKACPQFIKG